MGGEHLSAVMGEKQSAVADSQHKILKHIYSTLLIVSHESKYTPSDLS